MLALLLFLCLAGASASSCHSTILQHHQTNCQDPKKCGHLLTFQTSSVETCCAACNATCSAWTLLEGVCRTKSGEWTPTNSTNKLGTSGIRTPDTTTTPPPLPTPPPVPTPPGVKNILFIAVDDLRPEVGAFGHKHGVNGKTHTPNIDKLGLCYCSIFLYAPIHGMFADTTNGRAETNLHLSTQLQRAPSSRAPTFRCSVSLSVDHSI